MWVENGCKKRSRWSHLAGEFLACAPNQTFWTVWGSMPDWPSWSRSGNWLKTILLSKLACWKLKIIFFFHFFSFCYKHISLIFSQGIILQIELILKSIFSTSIGRVPPEFPESSCENFSKMSAQIKHLALWPPLEVPFGLLRGGGHFSRFDSKVVTK